MVSHGVNTCRQGHRRNKLKVIENRELSSSLSLEVENLWNGYILSPVRSPPDSVSENGLGRNRTAFMSSPEGALRS